MPSFVQDVLDMTQHAESPRRYFYWAALAALSAAVKNNVWIDKLGLYKLFPNIFVLLVGKSGLRKGLPVQVAKKAVSMAGATKVIAGRNSIQGIIADLAQTTTTPGTQGPPKDASAFVVSGEFSTALIQDPQAFTILTDFYDGHYNETWKNTLKHSGVEELNNISMSLLGAMNQTHFDETITEREISGGFLARTFVVVESKRSQKNSLLRGQVKPIDYESLANYLRNIATVAGPMQLTDPAIDLFDAWYQKFEPENMPDKTGTANRIHDSILKVAMLLSLSEGATKVIEKHHVEEAFRECAITSGDVHTTTLSVGKHESAGKQKVILTSLMASPNYTATRSTILMHNMAAINHVDLDLIAETLQQSGMIEVFFTKVGTKNELTYKLSKKFMAAWQAKAGGQNTP